MTTEDFSSIIQRHFPYTTTDNQKEAINMLSEFLIIDLNNGLFVLKGYAGTGKTTIVGSLVNSLNLLGKKSMLLAPTGRAAKVLTSYSGQQAYTIHKKLYYSITDPDNGYQMILSENYHKDTIFMVDEASMIPDKSVSPELSLFTKRDLLEDLINYVYGGEGCKLILIGDEGQLPPVGLSISPALDIAFLKNTFNLEIKTITLKDVVRQSLNSGILANATTLRNITGKLKNTGFIKTDGFSDIVKIHGEEMEDALNQSFSNRGSEETVIITRSNKRANLFNQEVRKRILFRDQEINSGDLMMVVKNNYYWIDKTTKPGFIANGDIFEIKRINKIEELYGFRFAEVIIRLIDYPEEKDLSVKIFLDTLSIESPSFPHHEIQKLFAEIMKDYDEIPFLRKRTELVKNNPYFNALQVKFAYALKCHKTQGGQWENVFIDQGYLPDDNLNEEYFRWLYTAFTRATRKLFLVNFNDKFFC
jgi:exodeoxyribonuclease-5